MKLSLPCEMMNETAIGPHTFLSLKLEDEARKVREIECHICWHVKAKFQLNHV